jgi:hypothetical protein
MKQIEAEQATKTANKIKELYIKRFRYISEIKAYKDLEHSLVNFILFIGREKDGSEVIMKKYLLEICIIEILKLEDKSIGAGEKMVNHNKPLLDKLT